MRQEREKSHAWKTTSALAQHAGLLIVLMAGLGLRICFLILNSHSPDFASPILDPQLNDYWARALISGDWTPPPHAEDPEIRSTPYGRPPGYPYLLAAMYWVSGGSWWAPRLFQIIAGLVAIGLVYHIGLALFGKVAGLGASMLMAVYWTAIYFEGELNSPVWEVLLLLLSVTLLLRWKRTASSVLAAIAGALGGLLILIRPNMALTVAAIILWMAWTGIRSRHSVIHAAKKIIPFLIALSMLVFPAILRNALVAGEFVFVSYYGGINAYIGNNPQAEGTAPEVPDLFEWSGMEKWNCFNYPQLVRGLSKKLNRPEMGYAEASRYFYGQALRFWRDQPLSALLLTVRKAWFFWGPHEVSDSKVIHYARVFSPLLRWLPGFPLILSLAMMGLILAVCKRDFSSSAKNDLLLVGLMVVSYFLSVLPFFIAGRYRFPVAPLLLPFAGYAVACFLSSMQRGKFLRSAGMTVAAIILYGIVSHPWRPYTPDLSVWHAHRGIAHAAVNHEVEAIREFQSAVALNPNNEEAQLQLGYLYTRQGRSADALKCYQKAVSINPRNGLAWNNLGYEQYRLGQYDDAEQSCRRALELKPEFTLALNNLGNTLLEKGGYADALHQFERVRQLNPDDPFAEFNIGNVYLRRNDFQQAIAHYHRAYEITPENPDIANNLGFALACDKQWEESIEWLQKALTLAPNHLLAHFNLGEVYGSLGEIEKAKHHFERCLELNPEHATARKRLQALAQTQPEE